MGLRTFTTVGESSLVLCSAFSGWPTQWSEIAFIMIMFFLSFLVCLWMWFFLFLFLVGWQHLPVYGCSIVAMLVPSQEEMSTCPSIQPSWTNLSQVLFYNVIFPHVFLSLIFLFFLDFTFFKGIGLCFMVWKFYGYINFFLCDAMDR